MHGGQHAGIIPATRHATGTQQACDRGATEVAAYLTLDGYMRGRCKNQTTAMAEHMH